MLPVTVIAAGPCIVTAVRETERDGYAAVQLAFDEVSRAQADQGRARPPEEGRSAGRCGPWSSSATRTSAARTARRSATTPPSSSSSPASASSVAGVGKGKGFQGTIKRHGFGRGPVSHGSHNVRAPGSAGASADPARIFKGQKMPGQMGNKRVTQRGLEVVEIDAENHLLLLRGAVPGPEERHRGGAERWLAPRPGARQGEDGQGRSPRALLRGVPRVARPRRGPRRPQLAAPRAPPRRSAAARSR